MKKIKIFVGVCLCINLLTTSGCDKIVYSAVVEEKDKNVARTEKEIVQKTVAEQVQVPEIYQTTIQSDLRSAERADKEKPMKFTLTVDAPVEVPDVDAIHLKKVSKVAISKEEQQKVLDIFGKGQPMKENDDGLVETYEVDGLTYQYLIPAPENQSNIEELCFREKNFAFDDAKEESLSSDQKKQRAERFQNYIKAGKQKVTKKESGNYVKNIVSGEWRLFESKSKELTEESNTLEMDSFFFERMVDGVPVNYIQNAYLPGDKLSSPWIDEYDNFHEAQSKGWDNESLTMFFCGGTLQSFTHSNPIEVSDASDEALFLLPFDEIRDIFEGTITTQIMTGEEYRLTAVDGISMNRYPSIDAQSAEVKITKVQLGYMRVRDGDSSTEGSLIPVWDFYGTWKSQEPVYANDSAEAIISSVAMDSIGVPLLTIDARDGSVIQRVQGRSTVSFPVDVTSYE